MINVETDLDKYFFEKSDEYQGALIRYNISVPLTDFSKDSIPQPSLLEKKFTKNNYWYYSLGKRAPKNIPKKDIFQAVINRFLYLSKIRKYSWFTSIVKSISISGDFILFETRFKIGNLDYILSWIGFSLETINGVYIGKYIPVNKGKYFMLKPNNSDNYHNVCFIYTKTRAEGKELYERGKIDLGWGIGVPPEFFLEDDRLFYPSEQIPFWFTLQLQKNIPVKKVCNNFKRCIPGVNFSASRIKKNEKTEYNKSYIDNQDVKVYCSDFPPNRLVLENIIDNNPNLSFGGYLDYKEMINESRRINKLSINTRIHAGQLGMYPEYINILFSNQKGEMLDRTIDLLASNFIHEEWLLDYEYSINKLYNKITIGTLKSRFRTSKMLNFNYSSFIDFSGVR